MGGGENGTSAARALASEIETRRVGGNSEFRIPTSELDGPTHASYGRAIDRLSARLNRKGRQERQDIAKDLLPIANKKFLLCALCVLRGSNGWVGKTKN